MPVLFPYISDSPYIRLYSAGYLELGSWWPHTDHIRSLWRLCRADDGGAGLVYDGKRYAMPAGRFVLVPPGLNFEAFLERRVRKLFVLFEVIGWTAPTVADLFAEPLTLPRDELRERLADELREEVSDSDRLGPALSSRLKSLVHLVLASLEEVLPEEKVALMRRVADGQEHLLGVLRFIDHHLAEPLENGRLAQIASTSESCFIRRFREAIGQTPARYVQDRRVARASELLVSTNYSIDEIAERCGFANRHYFSRVFCERVGRPPGRYRSVHVRAPRPAAS